MTLKKRAPSAGTLRIGGADMPPALAKAFKELRIDLDFLPAAQACKALLIASAQAGEGKSSVAFNLATAMAQAGQRVTLVDADLRSGALSHALGAGSGGAGLSDVLAGAARSEDVLVPLPDTGISLLPCGALPQDPAELLFSPRMAALIQELKKNADRVIIDTPDTPAGAVLTDAALLSRAADGVLLVVRSGVTAMPEAQSAKQQLAAAGANVLGVVLNGYDSKRNGRGS